MIVQTASPGKPNLIILQTDHADTCGQIAVAFGNERFAPPEPREPMLFVAAHHDDGWIPVDALVEMDVNTGLPYHLGQTPMPLLLQTNAGSPAVNEQYHPYSGMMSSMHTVGLYYGRYGLSDKVFINTVPGYHRTATENMLMAELERQDRLKEILEADPETAVLIQDKVLFHNYKLLQFFDTLGLYFHMIHEEGRGASTFQNVPQAVGDDVTITINRIEAGVYTLSPYPFCTAPLTIHYQARPLTPQPAGTDLKTLLAEIEPVRETITLRPA
jgi:hypothetical protein